MKALIFIFLVQLTCPISVEKAKKNILSNKKYRKNLGNVKCDFFVIKDID
jgi:hypothetical protein